MFSKAYHRQDDGATVTAMDIRSNAVTMMACDMSSEMRLQTRLRRRHGKKGAIMESGEFIMFILYITISTLLVGLGIPLLLEWIPPNPLYVRITHNFRCSLFF